MPAGIRAHSLCRRAAADPRLRPHGHWDWRYVDCNFNLNYNQQDATIFILFISKTLHMFQAVPPPNISSTQLYTQLRVLSAGTAVGWCV